MTSHYESWKRNAEDIALQKQSLQDAILKAGLEYVRSFLMADEIKSFDAAMSTAYMRHGEVTCKKLGLTDEVVGKILRRYFPEVTNEQIEGIAHDLCLAKAISNASLKNHSAA